MKLTKDIVHGFVGSVLSSKFDDATSSPDFHLELWDLATSDFQYVAIAAPRGHAKSTAGTLAYGLAELLFRTSKYLVIVSDTEAQATMFVQAIKAELADNKELVELFDIKLNEKNETNFIKDTETDIICQFKDGATFRVVGKGAGQALRGMLWNNTRPDLIIIDDLENDELVMNKDRRDKLKNWFRKALLPILSPRGKVRMWGTILHMDSVLEGLMPSMQDKYFRESALKEWTDNPRKQMWKSVKYRAHDDRMTEFLWPERFDKDYFVLKRQDAAENGMLEAYSQEYLNRPIDETTAYFKKKDLRPQTLEDKDKVVKFYATCDLAISEERRSDWTVFLVAAVDEDKKIYVRHIIRERMDAREIVDTMLALQRAYDLQAFGVEEMMISKSIGPFLREEMIKQNVFINLIKMKHSNKDKISRARSIQARCRAGTVKVDTSAEWYPAFEDEVMKFPRGVKDDQVDAFAYLGLMLDTVVEAPTLQEIEEEEYLDELNDAGNGLDGRSKWTGY